MRVTGIFTPDDHPQAADPATAAALATLFGTLFPGVADPRIDANHAGLAIAAHNPRMAGHLAQLSRFLALETGWCRRADLRELAIQTVNSHFHSDYSWRTRLLATHAAGLTDDLLAAIPAWRTSNLFDDEQKLVIEYAQAVIAADVPEALFARIRERFGEAGAVECTAIISFWAFWALFLSATRSDT